MHHPIPQPGIADPPAISEHHVRLPEQLAAILEADRAHARGIDGRGVRVAIIDSGFHEHAYYEARGYRITRVPTRKEPRPERDEYGHGTAQLASLLAIAPRAEVLAIKCMARDPSYALQRALALQPDILCCAWGFDIDRPGSPCFPAEFARMRGIIDRAIARGVCVLAAAGNGQYAFPGSMRQVISVGGAHYSERGELLTSDVSSEFESAFFPGRFVPDVCGLAGRRPHGRLLLVPVPPGASLARRSAFAAIAAGDARPLRKAGWAMFSGTSASTAMISGAAALLRQARPDLSPTHIRVALRAGARPVVDGDALVVSVEASLRWLELQSR